MVDEVTAFKCSLTGQFFENPREAARCEFRTMMRRFVSQMPSPTVGSDAKELADWLSSNLEGGIYMGAVSRFFEVADYLRTNRETLSSR